MLVTQPIDAIDDDPKLLVAVGLILLILAAFIVAYGVQDGMSMFAFILIACCFMSDKE